MTAYRVDTGRLGEFRIDHNGSLICTGAISRVGVYTYRHLDGKITRELRDPKDVFDVRSVASFTQVPVTDGHPSVGRVTPDNVKKLAVGNLGDTITRGDDDRVMADLIIRDSQAIAKVRPADDGVKPIRQLSCGYEAEVIEERGVYNGEHYDHRQTNIRGNHVALVREGRAGPEVRLLMDAVDAEQVLDPDGMAFVMDNPVAGYSSSGEVVEGLTGGDKKKKKKEGEDEEGKKDAEDRGNIIEHTKSGRPIFENHQHDSHKKFTAQDHKDASTAHRDMLTSTGFSTHNSNSNRRRLRAMEHHDGEHRRLRRSGDRSGNSIGKTATGKDIFDEKFHPSHASFNGGEHEDAAKLHESMFHKAQADRTEAELAGTDKTANERKWMEADRKMHTHSGAQELHLEEAKRQRLFNFDHLDKPQSTATGKVVMLRPAGRSAS